MTKSGQNSPVGRDKGLRASPLACQEGTSVFWQMSRVLRGGGAIGSLQPSEVTVSVTVQGRSEMEMEARGGEVG